MQSRSIGSTLERGGNPPMSVLVLNASYEALCVVSWQRAMCLLVGGRADLVERKEDRDVRSAGGLEFPFPSVVRLRQMVKAPRARQAPVSRHGIRARDGGRCQVQGCDARGTTIDHLTPRSRGGDFTWVNCVLMCRSCNQRKADRLLHEAGMRLQRQPIAPTFEVILASKAAPEWQQWLPGATVAA